MTTDHPDPNAPNPAALNWTYNHEDGLPHDAGGQQAGGARVHLSGDPVSGWIGDIHDGLKTLAASTEGVDALSALDHLHKAWQEAGNAAVEGWDEIKAAFQVKVAEAKQAYDDYTARAKAAADKPQ